MDDVEVLTGSRPDGLTWRVTVGERPRGTVGVMLRCRRGNVRASHGFRRGPDRSDRQALLSFGQSDELPGFVLGCALPEVLAITAELDNGDNQELQLSGVNERFGLRFTAAPVPDGTRLVAYRFQTDSGTHRTSVGAFCRLRQEARPAEGWEPLDGNDAR